LVLFALRHRAVGHQIIDTPHVRLGAHQLGLSIHYCRLLCAQRRLARTLTLVAVVEVGDGRIDCRLGLLDPLRIDAVVDRGQP
jgi:hypothetical protein